MKSPYQKGDPRISLGMRVTWIPKPIWGSPNRFGDHKIPKPKRGSPNRFGDHKIPKPIWGSPNQQGDCSVTNQNWFGDCSNSGKCALVPKLEWYSYRGPGIISVGIPKLVWAGKLRISKLGSPRIGLVVCLIWGPTYLRRLHRSGWIIFLVTINVTIYLC